MSGGARRRREGGGLDDMKTWPLSGSWDRYAGPFSRRSLLLSEKGTHCVWSYRVRFMGY
jgi:hypothetical protein